MEPHDYVAAAAFAQQQQQQQAAGVTPPQFGGYHQQQFPQHPSSFIPPHHLAQQQQQHPFHPLHHQQQQQQQLHPSLQFPFHRPLQAQHPHLLPPHQPFPPHLPPPHPLAHHASIPHPLFNPFEPPPPPCAPPADPELHKRIDKLIEYTAKNGPEFEAMIREKQKDNPDYAFLFGGEGAGYYHHRLWLCTHVPNNPSSSFPQMPPLNPSLNPANFNGPSMMGGSPMLHSPFVGGGFYDQPPPQQQAYMVGGHGRPEFEPKTFKGLAGPLPSDVAAELSNVLNSLSGTKESIKGAKIWFMQRSPFAPALAEALRDRVLALDDSERQLHIIYLANDILFDSLQRRLLPHELDNEALAFRPVLGSMLARIYHNPHNREANQSRLQKILQFWASKEVYDSDTIYAYEGEMLGGTPTSTHAGPLKEQVSAPNDSPNLSGLSQGHWQAEQQRSSVPPMDQKDQTGPAAASVTSSSQFVPPIATQFSANALPSAYPSVAGAATQFGGSLPLAGPVQPPNQTAHLQKLTGKVGDQPLPPYPLFPPGLIPGMVRKMQIGSGVPYSPMSPLDIPTMIPPSTVSQSYILERVSKFFKEIGEVNPSEGPLKGSRQSNADSDDEYEREAPVRKGGACIPPPPNLQVVDPETGTLPDGSVERKPGSLSSGRLGLGATANPNEVTQYDDVYTSYRKQRSTNYHSSMSARAAAR
ncbi:uncharacterized protein LOC116248301 [Nymphaea colorata]|nr:uncharacterized protein LOC116248301 [Nymphaea colorata]